LRWSLGDQGRQLVVDNPGEIGIGAHTAEAEQFAVAEKRRSGVDACLRTRLKIPLHHFLVLAGFQARLTAGAAG